MDALFAGDPLLADLQASYFERMVPFRLQIECSSKCSADCTYCYAKTSSRGEPLSTAEIKALIQKAARMGIRQIDWMGGDPMERQDWTELLLTAHYNGVTNNLWTSGCLLNDVGRAKWAVDLTRGGFIMVHLDSLDPETLRSMRSSYNPSTMRDTLRGVELLHDLGKPREDVGNLLMLTAAQRLEDVKETMTVLHQRYGMRTCLMSLKPVDGASGASGALPTPEVVREAYRIRDSLFLSGRSMGCQDFPRDLCGTTIFISLDGVVSSCYSLRRNLGSVRETDLEEIVLRASPSLFYRDYREEVERLGCGPREKELCWGCRANAFYFGTGASSKDPLCPRRDRPDTIDPPL